MTTDPQQHTPEGIEEPKPLTIPVHVSVQVDGVVLNQPEMRDILRAAKQLAIGDCGCRKEKGGCDKPLEVCLGLNDEALENVDRFGWRLIDVDEAMDVLARTYRAGLVHIAYRRSNGEIHEVCSCCSCCCGFLTSLTARRYKDALITSSFVAAFDPEACTGCGLCIKRCPFGAFSKDADGRTLFESDQCFGCGLCVGTCPSEAIHFVER
ncbi:MAG: 4Fe-4S dicluster domain-containing protein [Candidatus Atribacteria bacterium]|nr:MAG: 4Fe-4S dicluster domain-containing protein [Candidatus Atribacteria bacterium]